MSIVATGTLVGGLSIKDNVKNNNQMVCKKYFDLINSWPTRNRILNRKVKRDFSALTISISGILISDSAKSPARLVFLDSLLTVTEPFDRSESESE